MSKRGPKAKATALKVLAGSRRERTTPKQCAGSTKTHGCTRLTAPESVKLDAIARNYFQWLACELERAGIAETIDRTVIEHMALDYAEERRALRECEVQGRVLISTTSGNSSVNPHWSIMIAARKRIDARFSDLGMTPRARQAMKFELAHTSGTPDLLSFARSRGTTATVES
jgi:P27 family predicted phage terminase small subunit